MHAGLSLNWSTISLVKLKDLSSDFSIFGVKY